jgi:hypothetical protein
MQKTEKDSQWFSPSTSLFMINYRATTSASCWSNCVRGVEVIRGPESHENGKSARIIHPDESTVEL